MSDLAHAPSSSDAAAAPQGTTDAGASPGTGSAIAAAAAQEATADASGGRGLDPAIKGKMEAAFGADFSSVKVHTDAAAGGTAQQLDAHAFAQGSDIFFDQGKYDPGSEGGEKLIAHELAHVVQQRGSSSSGPLTVSQPGDAMEREADAAADQL